MNWLDAWMEVRASAVQCLVQTGHTPPPSRARWEAFLPYEEMERNVQRATVVVTQAAAASIMLCKRLGKRPIVVPRLHGLGEQVDDHQIPFGRRLAAQGLIALCESPEALHEALDGALADPASFRLEPQDEELARSVERFGELVDGLLAERRRR